ncbi:MAG: TetR family transcriptional regulator [Spirochaetes bacterium]|jgi:AcrR family transcriptional regulator|nr:TetR family transcriptional regulator [Spirochaetota bacterium]
MSEVHTDEGKKEQILAAAFDAFGEYGFAQTTVRHIADCAHVAPGSIYTYFADKEELFRSTVEAGWQRMHRAVDEILNREESLQQNLTDIVDHGFELLRHMSPLLRGMFSEANRLEMVSEHIEGICDSFEPVLAGKRGSEHGRRREFGRFHIRLLVSGILLRVAVTPPEQLEAELATIKRNVLYGFIAGAAPEEALL